jgi:hypothetical protein
MFFLFYLRGLLLGRLKYLVNTLQVVTLLVGLIFKTQQAAIGALIQLIVKVTELAFESG